MLLFTFVKPKGAETHAYAIHGGIRYPLRQNNVRGDVRSSSSLGASTTTALSINTPLEMHDPLFAWTACYDSGYFCTVILPLSSHQPLSVPKLPQQCPIPRWSNQRVSKHMRTRYTEVYGSHVHWLRQNNAYTASKDKSEKLVDHGWIEICKRLLMTKSEECSRLRKTSKQRKNIRCLLLLPEQLAGLFYDWQISSSFQPLHCMFRAKEGVERGRSFSP